jgi:hypothetical protein
MHADIDVPLTSSFSAGAVPLDLRALALVSAGVVVAGVE